MIGVRVSFRVALSVVLLFSRFPFSTRLGRSSWCRARLRDEPNPRVRCGSVSAHERKHVSKLTGFPPVLFGNAPQSPVHGREMEVHGGTGRIFRGGQCAGGRLSAPVQTMVYVCGLHFDYSLSLKFGFGFPRGAAGSPRMKNKFPSCEGRRLSVRAVMPRLCVHLAKRRALTEGSGRIRRRVRARKCGKKIPSILRQRIIRYLTFENQSWPGAASRSVSAASIWRSAFLNIVRLSSACPYLRSRARCSRMHRSRFRAGGVSNDEGGSPRLPFHGLCATFCSRRSARGKLGGPDSLYKLVENSLGRGLSRNQCDPSAIRFPRACAMAA